MPNNALDTNRVVGPQADLAITTDGSDWYFTVCAVMAVSTLAFMAMSFSKPQNARMFHYITAGITAVACIAYWSMGSGLGQTPVAVEFPRPDNDEVAAAGTREIFYVRYIDWFVTTPLLLLDLLLTAGTPMPTVLAAVVADEIMVACGLVGALTQTSYKWGYWVFGCAAFFFVVYALVWDGRRRAVALGGSVARTYNMCGVLTIFIWFLYPIAWGLAEGGNVIHPDSEAIFYGILDIIAKPVFGALLLFGHRSIDLGQLGLAPRDVEKQHNGPVTGESLQTGGATNGSNTHSTATNVQAKPPTTTITA